MTTSTHPGIEPRWDVAIEKVMNATMAGATDGGAQRFRLDVAFQSDAMRLVLFGPSGAGKSLTLMAIAGLIRPDAGHVRLEGRTLFDARVFMKPRERALGYLFQDYALFPHLTVRQNIAFGLIRGVRNPGRRIDDPRVREWLATFELDTLADRYPDQLSGGQRQRTALARALIGEPRALLLDEPFAALDGTLRRRLREDLLALQARLALPMILITHDESDVEMFGDCVVAIDAGRVAEVTNARTSARTNGRTDFHERAVT